MSVIKVGKRPQPRSTLLVPWPGHGCFYSLAGNDFGFSSIDYTTLYQMNNGDLMAHRDILKAVRNKGNMPS